MATDPVEYAKVVNFARQWGRPPLVEEKSSMATDTGYKDYDSPTVYSTGMTSHYLVKKTNSTSIRAIMVTITATSLAESNTYLSDEARNAKEKTVKQVKEVKSVVLGPKRSRWCK